MAGGRKIFSHSNSADCRNEKIPLPKKPHDEFRDHLPDKRRVYFRRGVDRTGSAKPAADHHLRNESKDTIKVGAGIVATLAALIF